MKKGIAWLIAILMIPTVSMTPVSFAADETDAPDSIVEETIVDENENEAVEDSLDNEDVIAEESEEAEIATFAEEKTSENGAFVDNEVIVVFENDITVEEAQTVTEGEVEIISPEKTSEESEVIESGEQTLVAIDENKTMEEALTELTEKEEVAYAQPNFIYELDDPDGIEETGETGENGEPADPDNPDDPEEPEVTNRIDKYRGDQWYFKYIDAQNAWDLVDALREYEGALPKDQRVKVATIDTGVSLTHEDLQKNIDKEHCVQTIVSVSNEEYPEPIVEYSKVEKQPWHSHGTNVTSVIAATSNNGIGIAGVAAGNHNDIVSVMGINPFYDDNRDQPKYYTHQCSATTADIIAALNYARDNGAQIVNMSMGHNNTFKYEGRYEYRASDYYDTDNPKYKLEHNDVELKRTIDELVDSNITVICSAGNDVTGKGDEKDWYPSDFESTISVIALEKYKNAYDITKKSNSNYGAKKDLSAPGRDIRVCTLNGDYGFANNTSNATPQVTGVAALMLTVDPNLTPEEIRDILCSTATGLYNSGWDKYTCNGMVNAYGAVAETTKRAVAAGKLNISEEELNTILEQTRPTALEGKHLGTPKITKVTRGKKYLTLYWSYSNPKYLYKIKIYRAKGNGSFKLVKTFTKKTTKWKNTGLKRKTKYRYKIVVYGTTSTGKKIWSPYSSIVTKKTK